MKVNSQLNPTGHLIVTTTKFQENKSAIMASPGSNTVSKVLPSRDQHIKRLATVILASACALLVVALKIQAADARSVVGNAIRGPDTSSHRYDHQSRRQPASKCDSGWKSAIKSGNKCLIFTQTRRNQKDASKLCAEEFDNATLPTVYNEEENRFLTRELQPHNPIWLGARYNYEYNKTYWGTYHPIASFRQEANYTNWDIGQPSGRPSVICVNTSNGMQVHKGNQFDSLGKGDCVGLWDDGKWGTQIGCLVLLPVVCEKKLTPVPRYPYVDGANGTSTSQYEQQQMFPVSSANTFNHNNQHLNSIIYMLTVFTIYATLNQQMVALVK